MNLRTDWSDVLTDLPTGVLAGLSTESIEVSTGLPTGLSTDTYGEIGVTTAAVSMGVPSYASSPITTGVPTIVRTRPMICLMTCFCKLSSQWCVDWCIDWCTDRLRMYGLLYRLVYRLLYQLLCSA
jgi:hypothetical protein